MTPPAATVAGRSETKKKKKTTTPPPLQVTGEFVVRDARGAAAAATPPRRAGSKVTQPRPQRKPEPARRADRPRSSGAISKRARAVDAIGAASSVWPKAPRRVSGPAGGLEDRVGTPRGGQSTRVRDDRAASRVQTESRSRIQQHLRDPRGGSERTRTRVPEPKRAFPIRFALGVLALPDRRMLDRIVRGRAWIPMLGILLVAIVGMRVEVLKLGAGVGRSMNRASVLQSQNELLRESVSALSSDDRIEALATQMGMTMPGPMDVHFIAAKSGTASRAGSSIVAPDPASFRDSVQTEQSADASSAITAPQSSAAGTYAPDGTVVADAASTAGTSAGVPAATVGSTAASTGAAVDSAASTAATSTAPQTSTVPETSTAPDTSTVPAASTTPATSTAPETVTAPETSTAPDTAAVDTGAVSASDVSNGGATSTAPTTGGTGLAG